ncbi:cupin domain-containing protein [Streptomyces sp. NPDC002309]
MTEPTNPPTRARVVGHKDAPPQPHIGGIRNRFLIDGSDTGGRFSVVQHLFEPRALGGPMHMHTNEDEYTFVLSGEIGAVSNGHEIYAGPGEWLFKPRGEWHSFWNNSDEPAAVLEVISPAGFEDFFKECAKLVGPPTEELLSEMAAPYGIDFDWPATPPLVKRHRLLF